MGAFFQVGEEALIGPVRQHAFDIGDVELRVERRRKIERLDDTCGGSAEVPNTSASRRDEAVLTCDKRLRTPPAVIVRFLCDCDDVSL